MTSMLLVTSQAFTRNWVDGLIHDAVDQGDEVRILSRVPDVGVDPRLRVPQLAYSDYVSNSTLRRVQRAPKQMAKELGRIPAPGPAARVLNGVRWRLSRIRLIPQTVSRPTILASAAKAWAESEPLFSVDVVVAMDEDSWLATAKLAKALFARGVVARSEGVTRQVLGLRAATSERET